jgi:RTX calcium-binding nonapeptide repeat (4 copies)
VAPVRLRLAVALSVLLVAAPAGALAARLTGTSRADRLVGTAHADTIDGRAGNDILLGQAGNDLLIGGLGLDRIVAGAGNDSVAANGDAAPDTIQCGPGRDIVNADPGDAVASDCEATSRQVSTDTISGGGGQHATEVEPDSFSYAGRLVATFQVGRIQNGGATAIGVATSTDGARHWRSGLLPGVTALSPQPGTDPRASDPAVAFDAAHGLWLVSSLGIAPDHFEILVSRSPDAVSWSSPVTVRRGGSGTLDKEWIACDNWPSSPNRGRCYLSYLDVGSELIVTQTTADGGQTWSAPVQTSFQPAQGLEPNGAQPLPRPDGSLVVVYAVGRAENDDRGSEAATVDEGEVFAATSIDGGASFETSVPVSQANFAPVPHLRAPPLPSADVAADGRLYVAWHDCLAEQPCLHDRIVLSTSSDGQSWTAPRAVAPTSAAVSQFVPGLAVNPAAVGGATRLAVAYYTLPTRCVVGNACPRIDAWLVTSNNGGAGWSVPQRLDAQPMQLDWLPVAGGSFLGDYISTSFVGARPVPVYSLAVAPWGGKLRQAIMALQTG